MSTLSELATNLQALAIAQNITVGAAESCTGGNIAHQITMISGSSAYFLGGIVSYANSVKRDVLDVPQTVLDNPGAVSESCASAMAEGARRVIGADLAVATTGIAGPLGGTARKPVGTVYIAVATPQGTSTEEHHFTGDRATVITAATQRALEILVREAEAFPGFTPTCAVNRSDAL